MSKKANLDYAAMGYDYRDICWLRDFLKEKIVEASSKLSSDTLSKEREAIKKLTDALESLDASFMKTALYLADQVEYREE
jgi:hypothetical protein